MVDGEIGVMQPQAKDTKDFQQPPEARREEWDVFSLRASGRNQLCQHLDFWALGFWNYEGINLCCFKPPSLWYFVMETKIPPPPIVLSKWPHKIRLHLPASLAARYLSSLLLGSSHWDTNSGNVHDFLVVSLNKREGWWLDFALFPFFLLECMQNNGTQKRIWDCKMEIVCWGLQSSMLEGTWIPAIVELPYCPGLFALGFVCERAINHHL